MLEIRTATEADKPDMWNINKSVIATGDTYVLATDSAEEEMLAYWLSREKWTYVAVWSEPLGSAGILSDELRNSNGKIVGTFFLKANQPGLGSHVGNAGYMVAPEAKGKRVGRTMAE